jgi:lysophospholipase L1-like esterase
MMKASIPMKQISFTLLTLVQFVFSAFAADDLPALHKNDVVVFQGDSITDGGRAKTGNDYNHTMGQSYAFILSAQIGALYPERNLAFLNRGISGNRVPDLATRWKSDTLDLKPNFLSILVGINDLRRLTAKQYEQAYDQLLADTIAALPNTKIVLGEPFLLPVGKHKVNYAAEMVKLSEEQAIVAKLAAKYHLPLVRYQKVFDEACKKAPAEHWSWDGVHPHYAGHALMAQEWLKTVNQFWPKD